MNIYHLSNHEFPISNSICYEKLNVFCYEYLIDTLLHQLINEFEQSFDYKVVKIFEEIWSEKGKTLQKTIFLEYKKPSWRKKTETKQLCDIEQIKIEL